MTDLEFSHIPRTRHATGDSLRTLALILATVLVGLAVVASVPDGVWSELSAVRSTDLPDWHGNVAVQEIRH